MEINRNSGQVEVISPYGRVYLYTHDTARNLLSNVYNVLAREKRWDDPDYLARMIFCEMIPEAFWNTETGFGIGTQLYADVELLISLDVLNQKITVSSGLHEFDNFSMSFSEFLVDFLKDAKL